ncbi:class II aldolase/adducin family protein [Nocardia carnea]|uniref:class II aldolase/adducin family protein n=1 Tax=Nocardia carnea TaxID=37328 RepID=UPI0024571492|nr:class II aldolase/adducin family protein [Nocardia carnea]
MNGNELAAVRESVAETSRKLHAHELVLGTAGNVSARVGDLIAITATGATLATATPDDITVVDLTGKIHLGRLRPTSELKIHLGIYRSSEAGAVVHAHSPKAVSLSLVTDELPVIHYQQLLLGGALPVVPFAPFSTDELAASTLSALEHKSAAILAHHGSVAVGATLDKALDNALLLEWLCQIYLDAAAVQPPASLTDEQLRAVVETAVRTGYGTTHTADPRNIG